MPANVDLIIESREHSSYVIIKPQHSPLVKEMCVSRSDFTYFLQGMAAVEPVSIIWKTEE